MAEPVTFEFFHDCLSAWAYPFSQRLRRFVADHPEISVVQRVYPMADSPEFFSRLFPDPVAAKQEVVMEHWGEARDYENDQRIDCELMMTRDFPYPYSIPNARGCKAAELQGGQAAHWDYFDRVQKAHLTDCDNIADYAVLKRCAADIGIDAERWAQDVHSAAVRDLVREDMAVAARYGILRNPAIVADGRFQLPGLPKSILGFTISDAALQRFYDDVQRRLGMGYEVL
ncbi:MAG: DsbA family protein [Pseudomonadota bacterium]|nr:DsbA family protein [Pseudomonadota bacterium]